MDDRETGAENGRRKRRRLETLDTTEEGETTLPPPPPPPTPPRLKYEDIIMYLAKLKRELNEVSAELHKAQEYDFDSNVLDRGKANERLHYKRKNKIAQFFEYAKRRLSETEKRYIEEGDRTQTNQDIFALMEFEDLLSFVENLEEAYIQEHSGQSFDTIILNSKKLETKRLFIGRLLNYIPRAIPKNGPNRNDINPDFSIISRQINFLGRRSFFETFSSIEGMFEQMINPEENLSIVDLNSYNALLSRPDYDRTILGMLKKIYTSYWSAKIGEDMLVDKSHEAFSINPPVNSWQAFCEWYGNDRIMAILNDMIVPIFRESVLKAIFSSETNITAFQTYRRKFMLLRNTTSVSNTMIRLNRTSVFMSTKRGNCSLLNNQNPVPELRTTTIPNGLTVYCISPVITDFSNVPCDSDTAKLLEHTFLTWESHDEYTPASLREAAFVSKLTSKIDSAKDQLLNLRKEKREKETIEPLQISVLSVSMKKFQPGEQFPRRQWIGDSLYKRNILYDFDEKETMIDLDDAYLFNRAVEDNCEVLLVVDFATREMPGVRSNLLIMQDAVARKNLVNAQKRAGVDMVNNLGLSRRHTMHAGRSGGSRRRLRKRSRRTTRKRIATLT